MNREGAISGLACGLIFTMTYIIYFKFVSPELNTPYNWWFGISPEGIGTLGMIINWAVATTVARFTPDPPKEVQDLVEDIRIPKGSGAAQNH